MTFNSTSPIWTIAISVVGAAATFVWFTIRTHFDTKKNRQELESHKREITVEITRIEGKVDNVIKENKELKDQLKNLNDLLIEVKTHTKLLIENRIREK